MIRVVFHPAAEAEMVAAAKFHDAHSPGLGLDFIAQVQRTTGALATYPKLGRQFSSVNALRAVRPRRTSRQVDFYANVEVAA